MLPRRLTVRGRDFDRVCVRRTGVAVYRGDDTYLRIGPGLIGELATHRLLLRHGFPVARLLERGYLGALPYFVEASSGPCTLGDLFRAERDEHGAVSDKSFALFESVALRYARAQVEVATARWTPEAFATLIGVDRAAALLPELAHDLRTAFEQAVERLASLPGTLLHGDLHPSNVCTGGVIDLEGTGRGVIGYDVVTAVFVPSMCDVRVGDEPPSAGWFSSYQVERYLRRLDEVFGRIGAGPVSDRLDDLLVCRALSLCAGRHPHDAVWLARSAMLRTALEDYRAGDGLAARWGLRAPRPSKAPSVASDPP
jgi:hypothetical protein